MRKLKVWIEGMKLLRAFYFVLIVVLGGYVAGNLDNSTFLRALGIFLAWEYTTFLNNIHDLDLDRAVKKQNPLLSGIVDKSVYLNIGVLMGVASLFVVYPHSFPHSLFLILLSLFLGTVYSVPPFRFRRYPFASCFVGAGTVIALALGMLPFEMSYGHVGLFLVTFFAVSIGTSISHLESYEADKKAGISTIFTIFGRDGGKKAASSLLFLSFLLPLLIFSGDIVLLFALMGTLATAVFYKTENFKIVMILVMIMFLISAFMLKSFL